MSVLINVVIGPFLTVFCPDTAAFLCCCAVSCSDRAVFVDFPPGHSVLEISGEARILCGVVSGIHLSRNVEI